VRNISTNVNESTIKLTHQREADGRVAITTVLLTTGDTYRESIWAQEAADRARYVNNLCADKPGIGTSERKEIRKELEKIARATAIDLRFDTSGKVNGRASCSARLWSGSKIIETASLNLLAHDQRQKAIKHIAPYVAGRNASKRKIARVEKDLDVLFRAELQRILTTPAQPSRLGFDPERPEKPAYELIDGVGLIWRKPTAGGGELPTLLTNFTARIVANVVRTDGVEKTRDLEIEAGLKGRPPQRFIVKAAEFEDMRWPMRELGGEAVIEPEDGFNRRARAAIQKLSTNVVQKVLHTHTGWMQSDEQWVYLHAGGVIAAADQPPRIDVALGDALSRYELPAPPSDPAWLKQCIRASLRILELGAAHIVYPLYCSIWRPLLGECDLSTFINGRTQSFKSELASLLARHYGAAMHAKALPGSWDSTLNHLRDMAFKLKDAPFPIDDFKPGVLKARDAAEMHKLADKILRAQGNLSERGRCDEFGNSRASKRPRGMIIATGEELPFGQSLRARMWIIDLSPRDIDSAILSQCQKDAREGLYAASMSGAIRWLATDGRIGEIRSTFRGELEKQRPTAIEALQRMHLSGDDLRRTTDNTLNLQIAFGHFLHFALKSKAITDGEASKLLDNCWAALVRSAELQARHQRDEDPVSRFFQLLRSALSSNIAYISAADGSEPGAEINLACGYRRRSTFWDPGKTRIGAYTDDCLCLDTETSFRVANDVVGPNGDGIGVSSPTALGKHLVAKGLIVGAAGDDRHGRRTERRRIAGEIRMVWRVPHDALGIPGPNEGGVFSARARAQEPEVPDLDDQTLDFRGKAEVGS
jgi:hypothetical protein